MSKFDEMKKITGNYLTPTRAILGGAALLLLVIFGRDSLSYLSTAGRMVTDEVRTKVPLEFELERANTMITGLLPDIRQNMMVIAEEEVGVEHLRREVAKAEADLGGEREEILTLRNDLDNGNGEFLVATQPATPKQVREELTRRFNRYQTADATIDAKRQLLKARENSLTAARHQLDTMLNTKRDLEVEVENLKARLRGYQNQSVANRIEFDDTKVAHCQELVEGLRIRFEVADRLLNATGDFDTILTASYVPDQDDIAAQIDQYFDGK